jgi:hypothetical protein
MTDFDGSSARVSLPPSPEPLRMGLKPLLIVTFAGLVLIALSSAFLLGLAAVGLLALVVGGFELFRRHVISAKAPASYLITGR